MFTVSECSPMSARSSLPNAPDNATARGGSGGVFKGAAGGGGSGLTGGTDALRLACLECLEVRCCAATVKFGAGGESWVDFTSWRRLASYPCDHPLGAMLWPSLQPYEKAIGNKRTGRAI